MPVAAVERAKVAILVELSDAKLSIMTMRREVTDPHEHELLEILGEAVDDAIERIRVATNSKVIRDELDRVTRASVVLGRALKRESCPKQSSAQRAQK